MILRDQVYAQALLLAGELEDCEGDILNALCTAATASLSARLRDGMRPEDCRADFVAAASLFALAALNEAGKTGGLEEFRAGDLTVKRSGMDTSSRCLQRQAELIIQPFLKDCFAFLGV